MTPKAIRDAANSPWGRDPRDPEWQARTAARVLLEAFDEDSLGRTEDRPPADLKPADHSTFVQAQCSVCQEPFGPVPRDSNDVITFLRRLSAIEAAHRPACPGRPNT